jgi:hypothetical protein
MIQFSHCAYKVIKYAYENHSLLTYRTQQLGVRVYGPLMADTLVTPDGRGLEYISILSSLPKILVEPIRATFTIANITSGFRSTDLWSVNMLIYADVIGVYCNPTFQ